MNRAIVRELVDIPDADEREAILRWLAHRSLLGIAHVAGLRRAAEVAYRAADALAIGGANG